MCDPRIHDDLSVNETPVPTPDMNPTSPYGIICRTHEKQGLTTKAYNQQMARPDKYWRCPICGEDATWDDPRYDAAN